MQPANSSCHGMDYGFRARKSKRGNIVDRTIIMWSSSNLWMPGVVQVRQAVWRARGRSHQSRPWLLQHRAFQSWRSPVYGQCRGMKLYRGIMRSNPQAFFLTSTFLLWMWWNRVSRNDVTSRATTVSHLGMSRGTLTQKEILSVLFLVASGILCSLQN